MIIQMLSGKEQILIVKEFGRFLCYLIVVVGVDPAVTSKEGSDDTGIIVAGKSAGAGLRSWRLYSS